MRPGSNLNMDIWSICDVGLIAALLLLFYRNITVVCVGPLKETSRDNRSSYILIHILINKVSKTESWQIIQMDVAAPSYRHFIRFGCDTETVEAESIQLSACQLRNHDNDINRTINNVRHTMNACVPLTLQQQRKTFSCHTDIKHRPSVLSGTTSVLSPQSWTLKGVKPLTMLQILRVSAVEDGFSLTLSIDAKKTASERFFVGFCLFNKPHWDIFTPRDRRKEERRKYQVC